MRKIFHKVDFFLNSIFGIGFCLGSSLVLEAEEYIQFEMLSQELRMSLGGMVLGILFYYAGYFWIGKKEHKQRLDSKWTYVYLLLILVFFETILRIFFQRSLYQDLVDNFFWTIGCALVNFAFLKAVNYYWNYKVKKRYGDGSKGVDVKFSEENKKNFANYNGINKQLQEGEYDKAYAVKCHNGSFVGRQSASKGVVEYLGIPYAKAPVGKLRWQAPVPCDASQNVYEAYNYGNVALQIDPEAYSCLNEGEDCLYLNLWTANSKAKPSKKPVLVFLHPCNGLNGSNVDFVMNGDEFVKEHPEVIYVNIGYRFGLMGFMDFSEIPGGENYQDATNLGLLDQRMAIAWLKENVEAFGGDADNITVMGSTGSFTYTVLLPLLQVNDGLDVKINKIFSYSGSLDDVTSVESARKLTKAIAEHFQLHNMEEFCALTTEQLREAMKLFKEQINWAIPDGRLLPLEPLQAYAEHAEEMNFVLGTNKDEINGIIAFWNKDKQDELINKIYDDIQKGLTGQDRQVFENFLAVTQKAENCDLLKAVAECCNYVAYHNPAIRLCQAITAGGGKARYFYWDCKSPLQYVGSVTGMELAYLVGHNKLWRDMGLVVDATASEVFSQMVVNFMIKDNPSVKVGQIQHLDDIPWPEFTAAKQPVMHMNIKKFAVEDNGLMKKVDELEPLRRYKDLFHFYWNIF